MTEFFTTKAEDTNNNASPFSPRTNSSRANLRTVTVSNKIVDARRAQQIGKAMQIFGFDFWVAIFLGRYSNIHVALLRESLSSLTLKNGITCEILELLIPIFGKTNPEEVWLLQSSKVTIFRLRSAQVFKKKFQL